MNLKETLILLKCFEFNRCVFYSVCFEVSPEHFTTSVCKHFLNFQACYH